MLGASTVGSFLNPVGSPITHMFFGSMVKIWTLASAEESITLSTIPLFTFAGYIMAEAKTAQRLVRVAEGFFGWVPAASPSSRSSRAPSSRPSPALGRHHRGHRRPHLPGPDQG